jgi:hypothetical protein
MRRALRLAGCLAVLVATIKSAAADDLSPERVRKSLDRGVSFLKSQFRPSGDGKKASIHNTLDTSFDGGATALATLALLNAGEDPTDPLIQRALNTIRGAELKKTYVVSLQTMVLCRAQPSQDLLKIRQNVEWLQAKQIIEGPNQGGWSYPDLGGGNSAGGDPSNSQFALLALYEAEQVGVEVNSRTWRLALHYWTDLQNPDGSWGYTVRRGAQTSGTGSMTCAGIASMIIVEDRMGSADAQVVNDRIECCGRGKGENEAIKRGLIWLEKHFSAERNPGFRESVGGLVGEIWLYYYLYGVERVGRMTNRRFLGQHDWYREIARFLVRQQESTFSDSWHGTYPKGDEVIATSFAVLFLAKGRRPVLLAKLKHSATDDWNQHRGDVNNLTRYVESRWRRELTWQVVDLKAASVEDLGQTPVLYLCGSTTPLPEDPGEQQALGQKLRDYIDRGGFIFAEAYCGGTGFDRGFRRLMEAAFPEREYRLQLLQPEHPVWHAEENVDPQQLRPLLGIEYGCRTSVIYAPLHPQDDPRPSLSCLWELSRAGREQKYSQAVQDQIQAGLSIGVNVLAYATNREVQSKEEWLRNTQERSLPDHIDRGRLRVASILHPGGCTAAPRALVNLLEAAGRELDLRIDTDTKRHEIALSDPRLFDYHLVFMHGRNHFHLTDLERQQLKLFLNRGGILFADSICASEAFTQSFRQEMTALFPTQPMQLIPATDPLFTTAYRGFDITRVKRRDPAARDPNEPLAATLREVTPHLEAVKIGEQYGVIFSPFDLSCALEKQDSLECQGYTREDAARIGLNVVLYSFHQ